MNKNILHKIKYKLALNTGLVIALFSLIVILIYYISGNYYIQKETEIRLLNQVKFLAQLLGEDEHRLRNPSTATLQAYQEKLTVFQNNLQPEVTGIFLAVRNRAGSYDYLIATDQQLLTTTVPPIFSKTTSSYFDTPFIEKVNGPAYGGKVTVAYAPVGNLAQKDSLLIGMMINTDILTRELVKNTEILSLTALAIFLCFIGICLSQGKHLAARILELADWISNVTEPEKASFSVTGREEKTAKENFQLFKNKIFAIYTEKNHSETAYLDSQREMKRAKDYMDQLVFNRSQLIETAIKECEHKLQELNLEKHTHEQLVLMESQYALFGNMIKDFILYWSSQLEEMENNLDRLIEENTSSEVHKQTVYHLDREFSAKVNNLAQFLNDFIFYLEDRESLEMLEISLVCPRVVNFLQPLLSLKNIQVSLNIPEGFYIKGSYRDLAQIIGSSMIIMASAVAYSYKKSYTVNITASLYGGSPCLNMSVETGQDNSEAISRYFSENSLAQNMLSTIKLLMKKRFRGEFVLENNNNTIYCMLMF